MINSLQHTIPKDWLYSQDFLHTIIFKAAHNIHMIVFMLKAIVFYSMQFGIGMNIIYRKISEFLPLHKTNHIREQNFLRPCHAENINALLTERRYFHGLREERANLPVRDKNVPTIIHHRVILHWSASRSVRCSPFLNNWFTAVILTFFLRRHISLSE